MPIRWWSQAQAVLVVLICLVSASEANAQVNEAAVASFAPRPSVLFRDLDHSNQSSQSDTSKAYRTHAVTGAIIGGAVVGSVGAYWAYVGPFENKECAPCALGGFALGGLIGVVAGGLIGGLFPQ